MVLIKFMNEFRLYISLKLRWLRTGMPAHLHAPLFAPTDPPMYGVVVGFIFFFKCSYSTLFPVSHKGRRRL